MERFKSDFLQIMQERGFIHQISDPHGLDQLFMKEKVSAYIGFDPTAASLHAGSLIQIMMLYWLQKTGHRPVIVMGGGTGLIGDPSFKEEARKLLSIEQINSNISAIENVFAKYLTFTDSNNSAILVNNGDWLSGLEYLPFLRDIGRHFSVNRMLSFDSVKTRLEREQSLSFLEFNYMILQAYDFVKLYDQYGVRLQMGGSDQWGNIVNGIDLGHRMRNIQLYALTSPLLTSASGAKMGKSAQGAVWLNSELFSVYDFWQYWRNSEDADVIRFLKLYTTIELEEIAYYSKHKGTELNEIKKILATEITALLHGRKAAEGAQAAAEQIFEQNQLSGDLPTYQLHNSDISQGIGLLALLVKTGFASSNAEARRHIKGKAIKINDELILDEQLYLSQQDFQKSDRVKLSFGKKKHIILELA